MLDSPLLSSHQLTFFLAAVGTLFLLEYLRIMQLVAVQNFCDMLTACYHNMGSCTVCNPSTDLKSIQQYSMLDHSTVTIWIRQNQCYNLYSYRMAGYRYGSS